MPQFTNEFPIFDFLCLVTFLYSEREITRGTLKRQLILSSFLFSFEQRRTFTMLSSQYACLYQMIHNTKMVMCAVPLKKAPPLLSPKGTIWCFLVLNWRFLTNNLTGNSDTARALISRTSKREDSLGNPATSVTSYSVRTCILLYVESKK